MRPVGRRLRSLPRLGAAALLVPLLGACARKPVTEQGQDIHTLYNIVLAIALVIGVGVIGMILLSCVRYRKQPGDDTLPPQTHGNTTFEVLWTLIPTLIVLSLFGMSFVAIRSIDKPASDYGAIVEVRGYQWSWTFDYGTNAAGTRVLVRTLRNDLPPEMVVPVGEKVHIEERTDNVIHSFWVPDFLFKRDLVPGKANGFDITVTEPGIYGGQCAEFCGTDHPKMTFTVRAVGRTEFDEWFNSYKPPRPVCEEQGQAKTDVELKSLPDKSEWDRTCLYVTADQPAKITFTNGGGQPHNVAVYEGELTGGGKLVKVSETLQNAGTTVLEVPALKAGGDYNYYCQIHPSMEGRYVVQ